MTTDAIDMTWSVACAFGIAPNNFTKQAFFRRVRRAVQPYSTFTLRLDSISTQLSLREKPEGQTRSPHFALSDTAVTFPFPAQHQWWKHDVLLRLYRCLQHRRRSLFVWGKPGDGKPGDGREVYLMLWR